MQIAITASPVFHLPLTAAHIKLLRDLSDSHHDSACKEAGASRGFLFGWASFLESASDGAVRDTRVIATRAELDICLKILEQPVSLSVGEGDMARELQRNFAGALVYGDDAVTYWKAVFVRD